MAQLIVIFQPILQKLQQSRGDLKASLKGLLDDLKKDESKKLEEKFMSTWKELAHEIDILCKDEVRLSLQHLGRLDHCAVSVGV
eukprot:Skav200595  [mRNA]  locus=scaffold1278:63522:67626:- [translate_table: standard]